MIRNFLIKCSGANRTILDACPEHVRIGQACIGGAILGTAVLAFFSGGFALYTVFNNIWIASIFGVVWALIIFNLDRFIVSTTRKNGSFWRGFFSFLSRLVLALTIGLIIAEPLILEIFRSEIEEELDSKFKMKKEEISADFDSQLALVEDARKANNQQRQEKLELAAQSFEKAQNPLVAEKALLEKQKNEKEKIKKIRYERHLDECAGKAGTGIKGDGPECKRTYRAYEAAKEEWTEIVNINKDKIASIKNEISNYIGIKLAEQEKADTEWRNKSKILDRKEEDIRQKEKDAIDQLERISSDGILARHLALNEIATRHQEASTMIWAIRFLFILIEILPILIKIIMPSSPYDDKLNTINEEIKLEQESSSEANRKFYRGAFLEHCLSEKIDSIKYHSIRSGITNIQDVIEYIVQERSRFNAGVAFMGKDIGNMDSILDTYYEAEDHYYKKTRETLH